MDKKFAIFDMDGTLVDSMVYWQRLASEFLETKGIMHVSDEIMEQIKPMTMVESAALFLKEFSLPGNPETIAGEMDAVMDGHYRQDIPLKAGVRAYLDRLRDSGVRMCIASATAELLAAQCLRRLGILNYFDFLLSCETVGAGKNSPAVYLAAAARLGAPAADIAVYEDALYAVETAKKAGFYVIGVYDESAAGHWNKICMLADETIRGD